MPETIAAIRTLIDASGVALTIPPLDLVDAEIPPHWSVGNGGRVLVEREGAAGDGGGGRAVPDNLAVRVDGGCTLILSAGATFRRGADITITGTGCFVLIGREARFGGVKLIARGRGCGIAFGADVSWESGAALSYRDQQHILIGDDCMISNDVRMRTEDGHAIFDRATRARLNPPSPVLVGAHVWLGHGASLNKGVRIGAGSVLGAESVASGTLDPACLYAGVPARKLREDIAWSRTDRWSAIPEAYR